MECPDLPCIILFSLYRLFQLYQRCILSVDKGKYLLRHRKKGLANFRKIIIVQENIKTIRNENY